ncbi:MAG: TonB-dependent receptor [Hyphomonadaceae bacterium]|nr:TonB-dependent receptor [Hyphomonadaceae bacterium]
MSKFATAKWASAGALALAFAAGAATSARAQTAAPDEPQVDDIMVTATKRVESLQTVPVSVATISSETINELGIVDIGDLAPYLANFEINNTTIVPNLYIRGLGGGITHSIEQSVGRFVDEIYIGRAAASLDSFFDIANVEVLRGPQGTLFGKNTVAGALIMRTADPTDEFDAGLDLTYGGYSTVGNYQEIQGHVSGPLSDTLRARLAVRYRNDDGYYINRLEGPDGPQREDENIRLKLAWDATPDTQLSLKLDYGHFNEYGADTAEFNFAPPPVVAALRNVSPNFTPVADWSIDVDCTDIFADRNFDGALDARPVQQGGENIGSFCPFRDQENWTGVFRVDHQIHGLGTLSSLSAYQRYAYDHQFSGVDMGAAGTFRAYRQEKYDTFNQEIRLTSDYLFNRFDFLVGVYYENSDLDRRQQNNVNFITLLSAPIFLRYNEPWTQSTETVAAFGEIRVDMAAWRLILGGRYSHEEKEFSFERSYEEYGRPGVPLAAGSPLGPFAPPLPRGLADASRSESRFTPSATLQYRVSEDVNLYVTYAEGFKTGGFSDRIEAAGVDFDYDHELNKTVEAGAKLLLLDGALRFNVAAFHMEIEGLQLATQLPGLVPIFSVDNAASVTSEGVELDVNWRINDHFTFGLSYAYLDATYDDFPNPPACPAGAIVVGTSCNLAGFPLTFAPENSGSAFLEFFDGQALGDWGLGVRVDTTVSDEYFSDIGYGPGTSDDGYALWNSNIRLVSPSGRYTVSFIAKNITNEEVLLWGVPSGPNVIAAMRRPRELAIRLNVGF